MIRVSSLLCVLISALLATACGQPRREVNADDLRQQYADRDYKALGGYLDGVSVEERGHLLPISAGYVLNNGRKFPAKVASALVDNLVQAYTNDPVVRGDPYAVRAAVVYRNIARERNGIDVDWSATCDAPPSMKNSCVCRHKLLQDYLPKMDDLLASPELDRSLWIAQSGAENCEFYDYPFGIFSAVILLERKELSQPAFGKTIKEVEAEDSEKAGFLLCAIRRHYLDYSHSELYRAETAGVFSCPTGSIHN